MNHCRTLIIILFLKGVFFWDLGLRFLKISPFNGLFNFITDVVLPSAVRYLAGYLTNQKAMILMHTADYCTCDSQSPYLSLFLRFRLIQKTV